MVAYHEQPESIERLHSEAGNRRRGVVSECVEVSVLFVACRLFRSPAFKRGHGPRRRTPQGKPVPGSRQDVADLPPTAGRVRVNAVDQIPLRSDGGFEGTGLPNSVQTRREGET